jgi:hypothetical protein
LDAADEAVDVADVSAGAEGATAAASDAPAALLPPTAHKNSLSETYGKGASQYTEACAAALPQTPQPPWGVRPKTRGTAGPWGCVAGLIEHVAIVAGTEHPRPLWVALNTRGHCGWLAIVGGLRQRR